MNEYTVERILLDLLDRDFQQGIVDTLYGQNHTKPVLHDLLMRYYSRIEEFERQGIDWDRQCKLLFEQHEAEFQTWYAWGQAVCGNVPNNNEVPRRVGPLMRFCRDGHHWMAVNGLVDLEHHPTFGPMVDTLVDVVDRHQDLYRHMLKNHTMPLVKGAA